MIKILSTKLLSDEMKQEFLSDIQVDEIETIQAFPIKTKEKIQYKNWIFTSVNGVEFAMKMFNLTEEGNPNIYCVGDKTKETLEQKGFSVKTTTQTSQELCNQIDTTEHYTFFCGTNRLETIIECLGKNVQVLELYEIKKSFPKLQKAYDGYLFFSPSGVQSFVKHNSIENESTTFAIGTTTAKELESYTKNIITPERFNLKQLLQKVNEHYDSK